MSSNRQRHPVLPAVFMALACAGPAAAAAVATPAISGADTAWLLTATALVLFMTLPGLAVFYGGLVRAKNTLSILMQCFAITGLVSLLWLDATLGLRVAEEHEVEGLDLGSHGERGYSL